MKILAVVGAGSTGSHFVRTVLSGDHKELSGSEVTGLAYHRAHGPPVRVTRGTNTDGPYQFPERIDWYHPHRDGGNPAGTGTPTEFAVGCLPTGRALAVDRILPDDRTLSGDRA